jgi:transcription termination/antitermination protein NusA
MSKEILLVVEAVSNEKDVPKQVIFEAVEIALASAAKRRFEEDALIRVSIDQRTGDYKTYRQWHIVADEDYSAPAFE